MAGPVGSSVGVLTGVAVGGAATVALQPAFEIPRQDAWDRNRNKILDLGLLARLVAEGGIDLSVAHADAHRQGYTDDKLDALVYLEQTVPGVSEALHLWRLGFIGDGLMEHVLVKEGLDQRYTAAILRTKIEELIGLGDIAYAVVRGILPSPSYVPVPPPTHGTKVERFPQVNIDPEELAAKIGFSPEALQIMVGRSGLSMAPGMAAQASFRNIIEDDDYLMAIAEGDLRTEWAHAVREVSRQILTAGEYAELELRGYYDRATRLTHTQKHGMTDADSDLLYDVQGRGMSLHSAFIADRRGGVFKGPTDHIPEWAMFQLQRGNLRPEVYNMEWAQRETLPSPFVIRGLLTGGAITPDQGETLYLHIGWPETLAKQVATFYGKGTTTAGDSHTGKAQNQLWTATHKSYIAQEIGDATATTALSAAGVAAAAVPAILALWKEERSLIRKQLSPTQIRKALNLSVINPATGVPWTIADAHAALIERGYDDADATVFLQE